MIAADHVSVDHRLHDNARCVGGISGEGFHQYRWHVVHTEESSAASMPVPNATPHNKKCSAAIVAAAGLGAHQHLG